MMLVHWQPTHDRLIRTQSSQSNRRFHQQSAYPRSQISFNRARCPVQCDPSSGSSKRQVQAKYRAFDDIETHMKHSGLCLPAADVQVLERASAAWHKLCTQLGPPQPPAVASQVKGPAPKGVAVDHYDVVVLGGTLGILLATALLASSSSSSSSSTTKSQRQQQPLRVAVVERAVLVGRDQEWNCSQGDLQVLVDLGVLTAADVSSVVVTHIPSVRVGVAGVCDITLSGVMDVGVSPRLLLDTVKRRFLELGGELLEHTSFQHLTVYDDCARLQLSQQQQCQQQGSLGNSSSKAGGSSGNVVEGAASAGAGGRQADFDSPNAAVSHGKQQPLPPAAAAVAAAAGQSPLVLSAAVVVDALGSFSPLSAQARGAAAPEAAMLLVGSCVDTPTPAAAATAAATGPSLTAKAAAAADMLWGMDPIEKSTCQQYWWERFPADGGAALTSYMFTFTDPALDNRDLLPAMMKVYEGGLEGYLGVPPDQLSVRRGVFGYVPCYSERAVPLVDRLLPVGDSAANRSALSLAGFCALLRHLGRVTTGLKEALDVEATTKQELSLLQPWCPGVTATTAMQRTMSVYSNQFPAIREAVSSAADKPQQQPDTNIISSGSSNSNSSGDHLDTVVLSVMGASLAAMWDAVGEEGMRPFVADRIQLAPLAASMATQLGRDARQLVDYSVFLGDTRGASRLVKGLVGLWLYGLLHSATPLTGPLHETLLAGSPRLLYKWHRYTDAWKYGSGADWEAPDQMPQQHQKQEQAQRPQQHHQ